MATSISKEFCFNLDSYVSIGDTNKILSKYYSKFENAFGLKTPLPIFLDTNILLNYYGMSVHDKLALKTFFQEKAPLIHITQQIEKEFQRNRISTIEDFFDELKKIKSNFKNDLQEGIKNKFKNILESKIVDKDFPEIMSVIKSIHDELQTKLFDNTELETTVNSSIDKTITEHGNMKFLDPILEVYKNFERLPDLSEDELIFIRESYSDNLSKYSEAKESVQKKMSFPGCGEKKDKDMAGDYIIFHEIIKFMKDNKQDAIFLTRDVTKSDWLQKDRAPFIHYIENVYKLTGQLLFIFDATDLLKMISFENIYQLDDIEKDENFYINKFRKVVNAVFDYIEEDTDGGQKVIKIRDRSINGRDIDIMIEDASGLRSGVIVYDCASSKKGYKRNVQRRINACNNLIEDRIVNNAILIISHRDERLAEDLIINN